MKTLKCVFQAAVLRNQIIFFCIVLCLVRFGSFCGVGCAFIQLTHTIFLNTFIIFVYVQVLQNQGVRLCT